MTWEGISGRMVAEEKGWLCVREQETFVAAEVVESQE